MLLVASLADFFVPMEKYVPSTLVLPVSLAKCRTLTQTFPAGITRHFGFERRLTDPESDIGFAFSVLPGSPGWALLVDLADGKAQQVPPDSPLGTNAWKRIQTLCAETQQPGSPLHNLLLEGFWVEYDIGRIDRPLSSPDFFLPLKLVRMKITDPQPTLARLLTLLFEENISPFIETNLVSCMMRLPVLAEINQIGAMMGRSGVVVRLVVTFPTVESAAAYLLEIGWQDHYGALDAACSWLANLGDTYTLQVDFNDTALMINPRIGLETRFNQGWESPERWHKLFEAFEQQGLCLPGEREALQSFPRLVREVVMLPMAYNLGVSHLKLVLYPERAPEAKAYFGTIIDVWNAQL
jgi:hypothetical protein